MTETREELISQLNDSVASLKAKNASAEKHIAHLISDRYKCGQDFEADIRAMFRSRQLANQIIMAKNECYEGGN